MQWIPLKKVFCVIDPTTQNQRALNRAGTIARDAKVQLHAYVCIPGQGNLPAENYKDMREAEIARHEAWLRELVQPLHEQGIDTTTEVECRDDWRTALAPAAKRAGANLIVKTSFRRSAMQRRLLKTSDWVLLRNAPCPVLFVKTERVQPVDKVLAAVNIAAKDTEHQALNDLVIEYASSVANMTGSELHAVNAYSGSMNFIHPPDLAKRVGIERNRAHVGDATPEALVTEVAHKLGSPLVVVGSLARKGVSGAVVGNTAERILDELDTDVVTIIRPNA